MSFQCPECHQSLSLKIRSSIELPPDYRSDEIALQTLECTNCSFKAIAIYEESRRGALDVETFSHIGYQVEPDSFNQLKNLIKGCPQPRNKNCACKTHQQLGSRNASGRCAGLSFFELRNPFPME